MKLNKIGKNMRSYPIPKDLVKTHLEVDERSRCKLGRSLYQHLRLTKEHALVTCERCKVLMSK
jgi:hypothetical protein